jgi:hypothetical protein
MASRKTQAPTQVLGLATARSFSAALCLMLIAADAKAYIDPGSGALIQQLILSGVFGVIFLARRNLAGLAGRLASLFGGTRDKDVVGQTTDSASIQEHRSSDVR